MDEKKLTFLASIAPLQSAIKIAHDGGGRVSLDIPESEMPALMRLILYRGMVLRVSVEEETQEAKPGPKVRGWKDRKSLKKLNSDG